MQIPKKHYLQLTIGITRCGEHGYHTRVVFNKEDRDDWIGPHRDTQEEAEQDAFEISQLWKKCAGDEALVIPAYPVN